VKKQVLDKNREQIFENSEDINGQAIGFYSYATELITKGVEKKGEMVGFWGTIQANVHAGSV
jgi:hypothetical protein